LSFWQRQQRARNRQASGHPLPCPSIHDEVMRKRCNDGSSVTSAYCQQETI
jgi:hypothetical protein